MLSLEGFFVFFHVTLEKSLYGVKNVGGEDTKGSEVYYTMYIGFFVSSGKKLEYNIDRFVLDLWWLASLNFK